MNELILNDIWIPKDKTVSVFEVYQRYEMYLCEKNSLNSIEKKIYVELLNNINPGINEEFSRKMKFNTDHLFPGWMVLGCLDELYRENEIMETNWQIKYAKLLSRYQGDGNKQHLKNAINLIPNSEFIKSYYRYDILNIIYNLNNKIK